MRAIQERAATAAWALGHSWLGAEHLLLAVLSGSSASSKALHASGITASNFAREIEGLSERYTGDKGAPGKARPLTYRRSALDTMARAEGLAAGLGSRNLNDDHVLLALLWSRSPTIAEQLLRRRGVTRGAVLDQLEREGVPLPTFRPPKRIRWGPWVPSGRDEALAVGRESRRAGTLYRLVTRGDQALISIEVKDAGTTTSDG